MKSTTIIRQSAARRRILGGAAVVAVVGCSSVAGVAVSGASLDGAPAPAGAELATAVPQVDAQALGVLRQPRTEADAVPAATAPRFSEASGANVDLSRKVETPSGNAWLVPGTSSLCLVADGGAVCVPATEAAEGQLAQEGSVKGASPVSLSELNAAPKEVSGVVPDGVETVTAHLIDGGTSVLTVHDNVYMGKVNGAISTVTFTDSGGPVTVRFR